MWCCRSWFHEKLISNWSFQTVNIVRIIGFLVSYEVDFKHQKLLSECGKRRFVEVLFQMWGRTAGGGRQWAERWEWLFNNFPCNYSLTLTHSCPYCCSCCMEVISKPIRQYTKCLFLKKKPTLNKLTYNIQHRTILWWIATSGLFPILLVVFFRLQARWFSYRSGVLVCFCCCEPWAIFSDQEEFSLPGPNACH